jgi:galactokinase/mevalonate kinase-like predicted kinase
MIISKTPYRISFFGGGSDYPEWYNQFGGEVISSTINKYLYISCRELPDFFNHKYRAVLYYYYFNKELRTNSDLFDRVYEIGNFLYQGRNLIHRGASQSQYQQNIIDDLIPNQHKYYFKFLGFLEDFISTVNKNI